MTVMRPVRVCIEKRGRKPLLLHQLIANPEKKIRMTATEKEKEWVRARATKRMAIAGGGAGAKRTTTEAVVEATAVTGRVDTGSAMTVMTATMVRR